MTNNNNINYTEFRDSIRGMVSFRDQITEKDKFYFVRRNRNKMIILPKTNDVTLKDVLSYKEIISGYENLCFQYVPEILFNTQFKMQLKDKNVSVYNKFKLSSLISYMSADYFELGGKDFKETRETRNKLDKEELVYYVDNCDPSTIGREVDALINEWNDTVGGMKYRRTNHSGYDKNFFKEYYPKHKDDFYSLFFYDAIRWGVTGPKSKLIGYSIISKQQIQMDAFKTTDTMSIPCYSYLIRKCLTKNNIRNLTLYIDHCSFKNIFDKQTGLVPDSSFGIHWGASKGSLLSYKESKFPVMSKNNIVFFTLKAKELFR